MPEMIFEESAMATIEALEAEIERLRAALTEMVERERRRYESTETAQRFFRKNNAGALIALARTHGGVEACKTGETPNG